MRRPTIAEILAACEAEEEQVPPHDCAPTRKFSGAVICRMCGKPWEVADVRDRRREHPPKHFPGASQDLLV